MHFVLIQYQFFNEFSNRIPINCYKYPFHLNVSFNISL